MKAFVDTNVLIDVLAERQPFYTDSKRVWTLAESGPLGAHVAMISFSNSYYLLRKDGGRQKAENAIRRLRDVFEPVDLTLQILSRAIDAGFADFKDAIQFHSALQAGSDCIITRNPDHFPRGSFPIFSPLEFLAVYSFLSSSP